MKGCDYQVKLDSRSEVALAVASAALRACGQAVAAACCDHHPYVGAER